MVDEKRYAAGCIYYIQDQLISLPGEKRTIHTTRRPVVVVSDQNEANGTNALPSSQWPSVVVVPISHSTSYRTPFDVVIPYGEGNLQKKGWARVPAIQMVDKDYLKDMCGRISAERLDQITAQILSYLGILGPEAD